MNELEVSELMRRIARIEKELKLGLLPPQTEECKWYERGPTRLARVMTDEELHDILRKGPSAGSYGCVLHQEEIARDVEQLILSKIKWPR